MIDNWTCGRCGDTQPGTDPANFVAQPDAPVPGTRIGVCGPCKRLLREATKATLQNAVRPPKAVQVVTEGADVPSALVTDEMPERAIAPRAPDSPQEYEVALVPIGECERCHGPVMGDPARRRKRVPPHCSDRCRVAAYHAAKKAAAA